MRARRRQLISLLCLGLSPALSGCSKKTNETGRNEAPQPDAAVAPAEGGQPDGATDATPVDAAEAAPKDAAESCAQGTLLCNGACPTRPRS
jgi:hypothetical protein